MARSKWVLAGKAIAPVTISVEVEKLSKEHDSSFKQVHIGCGGRIGKKSYCKACAVEVAPDAIGIAYAWVKKEGKDGRPSIADTPFTKEERKAANPAIPLETLEVLSFIPAPPLKFYKGVHRVVTALEDKAMFVSALAILRKGMTAANLVALLRYADNGTTYLATLDGNGILHELFFADEVGNEAENASLNIVTNATEKFDAKMTTMAKKMIAANADKTGEILLTLTDTATAAIEVLAAEKKEKGVMTLPTAITQPVVDPSADIMAQMMANLAAAGMSSDDDEAQAPAPVKKASSKKKVAA